MKNDSILLLGRKGYEFLILGGSCLAPIFLLIMRLHWGWQFFMTGQGKLANIPKITSFFHDLGIPFPTLNAYLAGTTECVGGLFLFFGLLSRLTAIPLIFTMIVAYATAEREALLSFFSDPDKFTGADPFLFMLTALIVLIFGPGPISIDGLIGYLVKTRTAAPVAPVHSLA